MQVKLKWRNSVDQTGLLNTMNTPPPSLYCYFCHTYSCCHYLWFNLAKILLIYAITKLLASYIGFPFYYVKVGSVISTSAFNIVNASFITEFELQSISRWINYLIYLYIFPGASYYSITSKFALSFFSFTLYSL